MPAPIIVVHGGAGRWTASRRSKGLEGAELAATRGFRLLTAGEKALDAVQEAVVEMEDNPVFNAGIGSSPNLLGRVEKDAAIMDGSNLQAGAVAAVSTVRNPIVLARNVMEETNHVLIVGGGAERIAEAMGFPCDGSEGKAHTWTSLGPPDRQNVLRKFVRNLSLSRRHPRVLLGDTVGALALDHAGNLAAAASTGGTSRKLPGRVGDSALIGSGIYADNMTGAAVSTGVGEVAIRLVLSKHACDLMLRSTAKEAALKALEGRKLYGFTRIGLVTLDRHGRFGVVHDTPDLCWAYMTPGDRRARSYIRKLPAV